MAVPKRRTSKKVKNQRRTHKKLHVPGMVECSNCGELTNHIMFVNHVDTMTVKK